MNTYIYEYKRNFNRINIRIHDPFKGTSHNSKVTVAQISTIMDVNLYRVSHEKWLFVGASFRDLYSTNTDDQWLILFPDMGDFVPKRNSGFKSKVWPAGLPQVRSQNKGYWKYFNICLKLIPSIQIAWLSDVFKTIFMTVFETFVTQKFNENNL